MGNTSKNSQHSGIDVEALLAKQDSIKNETLKQAIKDLQARNEEKAKEELIEKLAEVQRQTAGAVEHLRYCREKERKAKAYLTALAEAENQFLASANYKEYCTAFRQASNLL